MLNTRGWILVIVSVVVLAAGAWALITLVIAPAKPVEAYKPPYDKTWISPGKVEVTNYYSGGRAEWNFDIHNGNIEDIADLKLVTTEENETSFPVKLKYKLYGEASGVKISSDASEQPQPVSYNKETNELTISGCLPATTRQLAFRYPRYTEFNVGLRLPDHTWEGYFPGPANFADWVNVSNRYPVLSPGETYSVGIILLVPKEVQIAADKWEFWVSLMEGGQTGTITTEMVSRWLIDMKDK
jgi:hypothetical protein